MINNKSPSFAIQKKKRKASLFLITFKNHTNQHLNGVNNRRRKSKLLREI